MGKRLTTEEFIERARRVHGDLYDYSLVEYSGAHSPIRIICIKHDVFVQKPSDHLDGCGCQTCFKENARLTTEKFIERSRQIYGDEYDYSETEYINMGTPLKIRCYKHGYYNTIPQVHLRGGGCVVCRSRNAFEKKILDKFGNTFKYNWDKYLKVGDEVSVTCDKHGEFLVKPERFLVLKYGCTGCSKEHCHKKLRKYKDHFVEIANKTHDYKYDYSLVPENCRQLDLVTIICPDHGEFLQRIGPHAHGHGCQECTNSRPITLEEFLKRAKKKHGDKFNYSKVNYKSYTDEVVIICPKHEELLQTPNQHIIGHGCNECALEISGLKQRTGRDKFIEKANKVHGGRYKYHKVEYITAKDKVIISCDAHGDFSQTPDNHVNLVRGCPQCRMSKGELEIFKFLRRNNIKFEREKSFETCKNPRTGWRLRFDFYIEDYNLLIEFDGLQHESNSTSWEKISDLDAIKFRDEVKNNWSIENKIRLIRISYSEKQNINKILMEEFKICQEDA